MKSSTDQTTLTETSSTHSFLDSSRHWKTVKKGTCYIHRIGHEFSLNQIIENLERVDGADARVLGEILRKQIGNFGVIIENANFILGFVDTIRSYPIFYAREKEGMVISNSARKVQDLAGLEKKNNIALLEFAMTGYVTGHETVIQGVSQLQAGELLLWRKGNAEPVLERYFRYAPKEREIEKTVLMDRLFEITDQMFKRIIENAKGATIWVPLSGGLDSRLVLCKLKELGHDQLRAFSYGPAGNFEAEAAKHVAETLGVPWEFVQTPGKEARRAFLAPERKQFQDMADGLSSVPVYNEFFVLSKFSREGKFSGNDMIVNGQTGDYLTGGHIPVTLMSGNPTVRTILDAIIKKQYSVWKHLKTDSNHKVMENRILRIMKCSLEDSMCREELASKYESWEWQERQCKYVVNGQRIYDYLGLNWALPLWDLEYMEFWETVPMALRFDQTLFRQYLEKYDYKGLFKGYRSEARRWVGGIGIGVKVVDKLLTLSSLTKVKDRFLRDASYFGHYGNLYKLHGFSRFRKVIPRATVPPQARGVVALNIETWFRDNGVSQYV